MAGQTKENLKIKVVQAREYTLDGVEGLWMPKEMANKVLSDVELIPKLETKIKDLEFSVNIKNERAENFQIGILIAERSRDSALKAFQLSELKLEESNKKLKVWYRNPYLWFTIGIVVGVGVEVGIVYGSKR
jgi:hypothetical protein